MFTLQTKLISPTVLLFGRGVSKDAAAQAARWSKHVLLVSGGGALKKNGVLQKLEDALLAAGVRVTHYGGIANEPTVPDVDKGAEIARAAGCDGVFAVGGGSVLDTGKAISGMITNEGSVLDYIAGVGKGLPVENDPAALFALPTTAGTGTETTNNGVIMDRENNWKRSIRDDKLMAKVAAVDPELQMGVSAQATAAAGMDAICQLIEAFMSETCSSMTAMLALEGLKRSAGKLPDACNDVLEAREAMAYAAMLSGFAIAQAGVGAAHGVSSGLGAALGMRHGLGCAIMLPHVIRLNAKVFPEKCVALGEALMGRTYAAPVAGEAVADCMAELNARLGIPANLKGLARKEDIDRIWEGGNPSTMAKNPAKMSEEGWKSYLSGLIEGTI